MHSMQFDANEKIIKVCGMRDFGNITAVSELPVTLIGLIFYPQSSRFVKEVIPKMVPSDVKRVGVFVNAQYDEILEKDNWYGFDYIQLHGKESPEFCKALRDKRYKVIKAFQVNEVSDLDVTKEYVDCADLFLFDKKSTQFGGTGQKFDWKILDSYQGQTRFLLSGGIGPYDVEALNNFHHEKCAGIDLNSQFEISPGLKSVTKLKSFLDAVSS